MNENREDRAASIKRSIDGLAELMSPDLINALSEAAEEDELWLDAARDVRGFLHERGVALPDWAGIRLEGVFPPTRVRSDQDDSGGNPDPRWGRELVPPCKSGELLVARPGRPYCARSVRLCSWAPHIGTVCIESCVRYETEWLDFRCVPARDLFAGQVSIHEVLPKVYEGPEGD
jgi:hypothetical protein